MYKLYQYPFSQHSRRVVSLLEEAGLEYEPILVEMANGEHRLRTNTNCTSGLIPTSRTGNTLNTFFVKSGRYRPVLICSPKARRPIGPWGQLAMRQCGCSSSGVRLIPKPENSSGRLRPIGATRASWAICIKNFWLPHKRC